MKKLLKALGLLLLVFIAYLLFKTFTFSSAQLEVAPVSKVEIPESAVDRLAEALRIRTISFEDPANFDSSAFKAFNQLIIDQFPLVDSLLEKRLFNDYSHLFTWSGSDPSLKPIVLMGHIDVVPIAAPESWSEDPFGGIVKDGLIWGRGTIDDKFSVIGVLEAVEMLLAEGFEPRRTIYLSFGHDEEVGGDLGAGVIAKYLEQQGVEAEFVLDEGYAITQKLVPGIESDVALIGIAEKGSVTIELTVDMDGGHSSMPGPETAIDVLSEAIGELKENRPRAKITPPLDGFIRQLGPEMPFGNKLVFANANIFKPLLISIYEGSNSGNALVRTTTSPTIFNSGIKENVIPRTARALVNFRIIPGETAETVMAHVVNTIDDDRIKTEFVGFNQDPSPVSRTDTRGFELVNQTIKEIFPGTLTAPSLVIAGTDSKHFTGLSESVYRFVPYYINDSNIKSFHGVDERIPVEDYKDAIRFYRQLILNSCR